MKAPLITTLSIAIGLITLSIAEAKIYKWEDEKGQIHYAATPPRATEKVKFLDEDPDIAGIKKQKEQDTRSPYNRYTSSKTKTDNTAENGLEATISKAKRDFCKKEKNNLQLLRNNPNVTWIEEGKEVLLTGKLRDDKIEDLEESIDLNCNFDSTQTAENTTPTAPKTQVAAKSKSTSSNN